MSTAILIQTLSKTRMPDYLWLPHTLPSVDVLKKAGTLPSQEAPSENSSGSSPAGSHSNNCNVSVDVEISAGAKMLEEQRNKFRPLLFDCFSILALSKVYDFSYSS